MRQPGDHPPLEQVLVDDARDIVLVDIEIIHAVGIDGQDHSPADDADAAALQDLDLVLQLPRLQFLLQPALDLEDAGLGRPLVDRQQDMGAVDAHFALLRSSMTVGDALAAVRLP